MAYTEFDEAAVSDPLTPARTDAPVLLSSMRWSSAISPEAVLLSPPEVRKAWADFQRVRLPAHEAASHTSNSKLPRCRWSNAVCNLHLRG